MKTSDAYASKNKNGNKYIPIANPKGHLIILWRQFYTWICKNIRNVKMGIGNFCYEYY